MAQDCSILIIDDDRGQCKTLVDILSEKGFHARFCLTGKEGLEKARAERPDIVLVDLRLPDMAGEDVMKKIRDLNPEIEHIVITGYGSLESAIKAIDSQAFAYVTKPLNIKQLLLIIERIREKQKLARALKQSEERYRHLLTYAADMIYTLDTGGNFTFVSHALLGALGYRREELIGKNAQMIIAEDFHSLTKETFQRRISGEDVPKYEFDLVTKKGSRLSVEINSNAVRDPEGNIVGTQAILRDVTERRRAEENAKRAAREWSTTFDSIADMVSIHDIDFNTLRANMAFADAFGMKPEEIVGKKCFELVHGTKEPPDYCPHAETLVTKKPVTLETFEPHLGKHLQISTSPVFDEKGRLTGSVHIAKDITDRKFLESELSQAQKLHTIGQLAAGIAHEINTPTQYVGDNTRFLQESFTDVLRLLEKYRKLLPAAKSAGTASGMIEEVENAEREADIDYLSTEIPQAISQSLDGIERISKITRAMKEFSHPGIDEKTAIDLNKTIDGTITVCRNEWKYVAEMETDFDPHLPCVTCMPQEFSQVILNLVTNAADAIEELFKKEGGRKGKIRVTTRRDGDWAEIRISDTGGGIPEDLKSKIFEPFFTTKKPGEGTGQGLAISRKIIVEKHGGTFDFESEPGKGTTFIIRLPIGAGPS